MPLKSTQPKKPLFRRVSTYVALTVLGIPLVLGGTAWFLTRPERLARTVEAALGENIRGTVHIDRVHLQWSGKVVVENLRIGLAGESGPYARVLEAPRATIALSRRQLLKLKLWVKSIDMEAPVLHVVEDPATDHVNLTGLGVRETGGARTDIPLPLFSLNKGKILFERLGKDGLAAEKISEWELSGTITPTGSKAGKIAFHALRPDTGKYADLLGSFDLKACTANGSLTNACLRPEMALLVPREARRWWRTFSATGEVPELSVACDWKNGFHLASGSLQIKDIAIHPNLRPVIGDLGDTLVAAMMESAADRLWFDRINGSARVKDNVLFLPDLRATAHGDDLGFGTVDAKLAGQLNLTGNNQWSMAFTTDKFVLADNIPILQIFPDVRTIYQRFSPSGTFRLSGRAESAGINVLPELEARVELIDAKANYSVRPYPVEHLTGTLRVTLNSLLIENLRGQGVAGGTVAVQGKIAPLTDAAGADITVALEDVPYGEALLGALGTNTATAVRRFFSQPATEALRKRGLNAPEPGGVLDAVLKITRDKGENGHWGIAATVDPAGLLVILPQFPYPMKVREGSIAANETQVRVTGLKAVGPTGGQVTLSAAADDAKHTGDFGWKLTIEDAAVPVDNWFYAALPKNAEKSARLVGVEGLLKVDGTLEEGPGSKNGDLLRINLHGTVADGTANPFGGGYKLDKLAMDMTLHEGEFLINGANGAHGKASLSAVEKVVWSPIFSNKLEVKARNIAFEPELAQLAPGDSVAHRKIAEAFDKWQFEGSGDGVFSWNIVPGADGKDAETIGLAVSPKELAMVSPVGSDDWIELSDMAGTVALAGDDIRLEGIRGTFDGGELSASGTLSPAADSFTADLRVAGKAQANNGTLPDTVNALLPDKVRRSILDAHASGLAQIKEGQLRVQQDRVRFGALLVAEDMGFDLGLSFRHVRGAAALAADSDKGQTRTTADMRLTSCDLYGYKVTDGTGKAVMDPDGAWHLPDFKGSLAGGTLSGSASGRSAPEGNAWVADADLADAALEGIKTPATWDGTAGKGGELSAHIRLRNSGSGFDNLAGEGDFVVKSSDLGGGNNKLPLLGTMSLAPGSAALTQGKGHFTAVGRRLRVDRVEMSSPGALAIMGEGVVILPDAGQGAVNLMDSKLRLRLATRNVQKGGWVSKVLSQVAEHVAVPFTNELLGLRVTGTLGHPEVKTEPFADLYRAFQELLPGGAPRKRRWQK